MVCFCGIALLTGCLSPEKKIAKEMNTARAHWQADVARQSVLPMRELNWSEALALLRENNLKLRTARVEVTNCHEQVQQVFRDLIPNVNLRSGITKRLSNIAAFSADDVTFNIDSFFNVPGVVNFDARLFGARIVELRARTAYELALREQTIELYKVFLEATEQADRHAALRTERTLAEAVAKINELSGESLLNDIKNRELGLIKDEENLQIHIGELLMSQSYHWMLSSNDLPAFDYEDRPLPLSDTSRVAQLQIRLAAIELVGAWAQLHGIKLQYWPDLTLFVSGPTIFQRFNGVNHFWSAADATASADVFWSLDTRGRVRQQLRETRRAQELQTEQLKRDSEVLAERLIAAQKIAGTLRDQIHQLDQVLELLEQFPQTLDLNSLLQSADSNRSLHAQRLKLRRDLAELNTLFWFVDDQRWQASVQ
jgi:hypothetical protein